MKAIRIKILILSAVLLFVSLSASAYQVVVMVEPAREVPIYKDLNPYKKTSRSNIHQL